MINKIIKYILVLLLFITTVLRINIYVHDNSEKNRTLYYYGNQNITYNNKTMITLDENNIGCMIDNSIFQSINILDEKITLDTNSVAVGGIYCEKNNCNDNIYINDKEYKIGYVLNSRVVLPNLYVDLKELKSEYTSFDTYLVNDEELNTICKAEDKYIKIVFKSRKSLTKFQDKYNDTFYYSDIYIRDYMKWFYLGDMILIIVYFILYRKDKINGIKKS